MQETKSKLQQIREEIVAGISTILEEHKAYVEDITVCGSTPVIWPSSDDQDFDTFTLDSVYMFSNTVFVDSSSSNDSRTDRAEELGTDTLVEILEFLENNEDAIWEDNEEADEMYIRDNYHKEKICMGDLLAGMKVKELPHGAELTVEQVFKLYMRCKHWADGDEFFRENDSCGADGERCNLLID